MSEQEVRDAIREFDPNAEDWTPTGVYGVRGSGQDKVGVFAYWIPDEHGKCGYVYTKHNSSRGFTDPVQAIRYALSLPTAAE